MYIVRGTTPAFKPVPLLVKKCTLRERDQKSLIVAVENMRLATIICFTALCVQMSTPSTDEMALKLSQLRYWSKSAKLTRQQIACFVDKLKLIQERDLNDVLYQATNDAIFKHANPALHDVKNAVEAARNEGRNSSHCYGIATYLMEDHAKHKYKYGVIPCINNFTSAVEELIAQAKPIRGALREVQDDFQDSIENCIKSNTSAECSEQWINETRVKYESLKDAGVELMKDGGELYPKMVEVFNKCVSILAAAIEETAIMVRRQGIRCAQTTGTKIETTE